MIRAHTRHVDVHKGDYSNLYDWSYQVQDGRFLNFLQGGLCHYHMISNNYLTRCLVSLQYGRSYPSDKVACVITIWFQITMVGS